jgi:hypothetical protein
MKFHFGEKKATRLTNCMAKIFPDGLIFFDLRFFRSGKMLEYWRGGK